MEDIKYMKIALKLALKGKGFTEPNPMVGAVVAKDGDVVAVGYHRKYGAEHAEREALQKVTIPGTTLYITLEPCSHVGKTPPCADLIIRKKVKRVVAALQDPNPLVDGCGICKLEENGIAVEVGLLSDMARHINRHYLKYISQKMPYVTLKAGVSMDGKLTDKYRKSQWVTSEEMRTFSHSLRGEFSAIMVGMQTAVADDPQLNIRENAWEDKKLYRVVLDTHNRLDTRLRIFGGDQERFPLVIFSSKQAQDRTPKIKHHFFVTPGPGGGLHLEEVMKVLYQQEIASVLVEGGGGLFNSFLQQKLYDEIILGKAGTLLGGKDSVQVFPQGTSVSTPIQLNQREIIELKTGYFVRGYR
jgi:diaminohydroxyphosphoribosylaminopyrimidine deaminase/5-amino-6-(5-phosphoribosylamino)uracil reductase